VAEWSLVCFDMSFAECHLAGFVFIFISLEATSKYGLITVHEKMILTLLAWQANNLRNTNFLEIILRNDLSIPELKDHSNAVRFSASQRLRQALKCHIMSQEALLTRGGAYKP
jgi:hypothetical protein